MRGTMWQKQKNKRLPKRCFLAIKFTLSHKTMVESFNGKWNMVKKVRYKIN